MITANRALKIAKKKVSQLQSANDDFVIVENDTIETDFGWVFFYNSKQYLESGNISHALAGNAPIIVDRLTGEIAETGTAHDIDYYIQRYRDSLS